MSPWTERGQPAPKSVQRSKNEGEERESDRRARAQEKKREVTRPPARIA
ncbi:hypothetical protein HMPREF1868_00705 [Olsenella sp. DNF00959]|nr:hypothetical protein HMPREF1868_00705 [Olsenella sp. DNF00959]